MGRGKSQHLGCVCKVVTSTVVLHIALAPVKAVQPVGTAQEGANQCFERTALERQAVMEVLLMRLQQEAGWIYTPLDA